MSDWKRYDWTEIGSGIQHSIDRGPDSVYVDTSPTGWAREQNPACLVSVEITIDPAEGGASTVDIPCDILAEALRARGWTCA